MTKRKREMDMLKLCLAGLTLLSLAFEWAETRPSNQEDFSAIQKSEALVNKLRAYAANEAAQTSGITFEDLQDVYEESLKWNEETKANLKSKSVDHQMLVDFVITPMSRFDDTVGNDLDDMDTVRKDFVTRFERAYTKFRPNYQGKIRGDKYSLCAKLSEAIDSLYGVKDSAPLTKQLLSQAKSELEVYAKRVHEIQTVEDIYANLDELTSLLNLFNFNSVKAFKRHVLEHIDEDEKSYPNLAKAFREAMAAHKVVCEDGVLVALS